MAIIQRGRKHLRQENIYDTAAHIVQWLIDTEHLVRDDTGMLTIGRQAEKRYGRRHFMDLLTVFTAAPQFTVLHGRQEIGSADVLMLMTKADGPRLLSLGGRAWKVNHIDWQRRRCYVEPSEHHARSAWTGSSLPHSYELSQAQRDVLLGADPDIALSQRARAAIAALRTDIGYRAAAKASVVSAGAEPRWWTWAGGKGNATLAATLPDIVDPDRRLDNHSLRLRSDVSRQKLCHAIDALQHEGPADPEVSEDALHELKFAEILPPDLATSTLAARIADPHSAEVLLAQPIRWVADHPRQQPA